MLKTNLNPSPSAKGEGSKLYIGTSGYSYPHWENDVFYPRGLPKTKQLAYYAKHFNTVEMNYPFYKLPSSKSFSNWRERTNKDFIFAVKVSRYITHIKYLHQCKTAWKTFLERALRLKNKLGPFLFQLPPLWKKDLGRLKEFIEMVDPVRDFRGEKEIESKCISNGVEKTNHKYRFVLEFRHPTWFSEDVYQILKKQKNISLCLADSPQWPFEEIITSDFLYIRMHGGKVLYTSNYSQKELKKLAEKIKKYLKQNLDIYVYFNNDAYGYAIENARTLIDYCLGI